jgi:hypothetical protein
MSIRNLLSGIKPRTKSHPLTDDKAVILHELSVTVRLKIEKERFALAEKKDVTSQEYNESAADIVARSMLGNDVEPTPDDIAAVLDLLGVDQLEDVFNAVMKFNGMDEDASEEARKN